MKSAIKYVALALFAALLAAPTLKAEEDVLSLTSVKAEVEKHEEPVAADVSMVARMQNDKVLRGIPMDIAFIDIYVLGTKISVPLDAINGMRMGDDGGKGTIVLKDGEVLNGRIELSELQLSVDWGRATISRASLKSLDRSTDLVWNKSNTPNGSKWFLSPAAKPAPAPVSAPVTRTMYRGYPTRTRTGWIR